MALTEQQLLGEIGELIRTAPPADQASSPEGMAWQGRVAAILKRWDHTRSVTVDVQLTQMRSSYGRLAYQGHGEVIGLLHEARADLQLKTAGPLSVAIDTASEFDYFDVIRRLIAEARTELLFVDRYMGAEFVAKYMGLVVAGTSVRLLTRDRLTSLIPAAHAFTAQHGLTIAVRSSDNIHDRYMFVDRRACYVSGASFKDGGRDSPTAVTQIVDTFADTLATYERLWGEATVQI
ncbi:hypothetical protein [Reyranella sp.]|uniref:hypothetical protein n=1 Tax=Reyranella sp. TaxID=1929291 RepID=UPI003D09D33F